MPTGKNYLYFTLKYIAVEIPRSPQQTEKAKDDYCPVVKQNPDIFINKANALIWPD
ncbi:hypothetical protein [Adhaeribacter aquaticus]|uniref:hypothetical protein n=1 Tax=Adhaeribacter aquaticus TaxID=299567 RepID=UPI0003F63597|nr:hypothetical protein [Adhaeribacter aquaticus]